jgi:hypothetical protein
VVGGTSADDSCVLTEFNVELYCSDNQAITVLESGCISQDRI